jgi:hypothetical protein
MKAQREVTKRDFLCVGVRPIAISHRLKRTSFTKPQEAFRRDVKVLC